jgi:hypothetical protein
MAISENLQEVETYQRDVYRDKDSRGIYLISQRILDESERYFHRRLDFVLFLDGFQRLLLVPQGR